MEALRFGNMGKHIVSEDDNVGLGIRWKDVVDERQGLEEVVHLLNHVLRQDCIECLQLGLHIVWAISRVEELV